MPAKPSIVLFLLALVLAPSAHAQSACDSGWWWDSAISIERVGVPPSVLVQSHASFAAGTPPHDPVVTRAGDQFSITYALPTVGPAVDEIWSHTFALGTVPPGHYSVAVQVNFDGVGPICPLGSADFLVASSAPTLNPLALGALCLALGATGYALLRARQVAGA